MSQHKSVTIRHRPLEKEVCCPDTALPQVPRLLRTGEHLDFLVTTGPWDLDEWSWGTSSATWTSPPPGSSGSGCVTVHSPRGPASDPASGELIALDHFRHGNRISKHRGDFPASRAPAKTTMDSLNVKVTTVVLLKTQGKEERGRG